MKSKLFILGGTAFCALSVAHANVTVQWLEDSYTAFDVIFSGTGLESPNNSASSISPSGLWEVHSCSWGGYNTRPGDPYIDIGNNATVRFLKPLPYPVKYESRNQWFALMSAPYDTWWPASAPIRDGNAWEYGYLLFGYGWHAKPGIAAGPFTITSLPVVEDHSTWTWTAEYGATGPSLQIPEPNKLALAGVGAVALLAFRKRNCASSHKCSMR
jgi:hypothetical protein